MIQSNFGKPPGSGRKPNFLGDAVAEQAMPKDRTVGGEARRAPERPLEPVMTKEERERELRALVAPVAEELELSSAEMHRELDCASEGVREVSAHALRYRGKRLRAAASLLTARALTPMPEKVGNGAARLPESQIKIAAIVEMIHMATLVHDDVLDHADVRRRVPTVNSRHGNEVAVLLGDWIYARAFCISTRLADQTCSRILSEVTATICRGEIEQSKAKYDFDLDPERYLSIIDAKTASLYQAACELGARYALEPPVSGKLVSAAAQYGRNLGLAFQIVDDCLDYDGSEDVVGKSLGTDVAEGKVTLPIILLLRRVPGARRRVEEVFRAHTNETAGAGGEVARSEVARSEVARSEVARSGVAELASELRLDEAVTEAYGVARGFVDAALRALEAFPPSPSRECLRSMASYVVGRRW